MPDLPGFSSNDAKAPTTRAELRRRDRELRALSVWIETGSEAEVRKALNLGSNAEARVWINRGEQRWGSEIGETMDRYRALMLEDLMEMTRLLREGWRGRDWMAVDRALKVQERMSRLLGLDAQKDEPAGPQVVVIDSRPPWEREGDVVEGQAAEDDPGPGHRALSEPS